MRKISLFLLAACFAMIVSACGKAEKSVGASSKKTLVVAAYGGSYEKEIKKTIIPQFEKKYNVKVKYITGSSVDTLSKLQAQKANPQIDVAIMDDGPQAQARSFGLLAPLDKKVVTNLKDTYDIARLPEDIGVSFGIVATGLAYSEKDFKSHNIKPVESWNDLANPAFKNKLVLPSITNTYGIHMLVMLAKANGGDENNIEPGFKKLNEISKNTVTFDKTADVSNYFLQGQTIISAWGSSRVYTLKNSGFPIKFVYPKEGAVALMTTANVVKNAPNGQLAQKFVNYVIGKDVQKEFAKALFDGPVNKKVKLTGDITNKIVYGKENVNKLVKVNWDVINKKRAEWTERANKEIEIAK
ncbi:MULTISPECIES: ABC transporter substrate-binding protein [Heyndrickxia]|jgi:putative spermidine/putrescine transport system substrate-binding protein|uniref:ABC transporter, solute-binding protein n=1 Tax=Heyndrickxia coagulans TaxID=1398 RepID=A0A133KNJ7_HEYCO|nr:ABC transporter substrate-binding protein [Heyndrickxia coagulans]KWZ81092.1 ABC transporter, solute-binding protein [Heyndrickxia coagulans]UXC23415.1 ABC transporter substrate-binding protein [Heyndrickxia coagulans]